MAQTEGQKDTLQTWQQDALQVLYTEIDPHVQFDVLERTAQTCSDKLQLVLAENGETITINVPDKDDQAMILPIHFDGPILTGNIELITASDLKTFATANPLFKNAKRKIEKIEGMDDRELHCPDFIFHLEQVETISFRNYVFQLAQIIYKYFGDEAVDFVLGLINHLTVERHGKNACTLEAINSLTLDTKKLGIEKYFANRKLDWFEEEEANESEEEILRWALGTKFMFRLSQEHQTPEAQMQAIKNLLKTNDSFRRKLLHALVGFISKSSKMMLSSIIRHGWKTIANIDEVTDFEWWTYVKKATEQINTKIAASDKTFGESSPKQDESMRERDNHIRTFFEEHPSAPPPEETRKLKDVIGCEGLKQELEQLEVEHNPRGYDEKQREILARVSGAVARYIIQSRSVFMHDEDNAEPTWQQGFPLNFQKSKNATCFTGPWLIAMMLMECGIKYTDILYAQVNQTHDGQLGGHGGLILTTRLNHYVFIDHGYNFACRDLPRLKVETKEEIPLVREFMKGKINEAITIVFPNEESERIHKHMQFMSLIDGFASGHLYHVGLSFLDAGEIERAKFAFEMAHTFNRQDPDILYHLGLVALKQHQNETAEKYFMDALKIFPDHLFSTFGLGECAGKSGDLLLAKLYFDEVGGSEFPIWKGEKLKEDAAKYASMDDKDFEALFKKNAPKIRAETDQEPEPANT